MSGNFELKTKDEAHQMEIDLSSLCPLDRVAARTITLGAGFGPAEGTTRYTLHVADTIIATAATINGKTVFDLAKCQTAAFRAVSRLANRTNSGKPDCDQCLHLGRFDKLTIRSGTPVEKPDGNLTVQIEGYFLGKARCWTVGTTSFYVVPCPVSYLVQYDVAVGRVGELDQF